VGEYTHPTNWFFDVKRQGVVAGRFSIDCKCDRRITCVGTSAKRAMKKTTDVGVVFCLVAVWAGIAVADPASTEPSSTGTPVQALLAWQDQFENSTADQVLTEYAVDTDQQRALAQSFADGSIAASHLVKLARERWGADGEKAVALACSTDTRADDAGAHAAIDGDHATLSFDNPQLGKFYLVRRQGAWKIDIAACEKEGGPNIAQEIKSDEQAAASIGAATVNLKAGKYGSYGELVAELNKALGNQ
jgi:hypothetical protein